MVLSGAWLWLTHRGVIASSEHPIPDCRSRLAPEIGRLLAAGGLAAVEIGHEQDRAVGEILKEHGLKPRLARDLAGRSRAMLI